ncbi:MAG: alkaline phosphatase family protein [Aeromicrobium sp.]
MQTTRVRRHRAAGLFVLVALAMSTGCAPDEASPKKPPHTLTSFPQPDSAATTEPTTEPTASDLPSIAPEPADTVTKVLVFIEENHSLGQMKSGMPFAFSLAKQFGYSDNFVAIRHPSLPNYIAIAGGSTYGIDSNDGPGSNKAVRGASVFGQAIAAGKTAILYADGMPSNCHGSNGGNRYGIRHNPWPYFVAERNLCKQFDVSTATLGRDIAAGQLPNVGLVVPNNCNNAHDCSLGNADKWFKQWVPQIFNGPDWKSGHLAVILTADEDDKNSGNKVLTVVIHPSQKGNLVRSKLTHFSLSRLLSEVTGSPPLLEANNAPSMSQAFGLKLSAS